MADARAHFFDSMERELLEQVGGIGEHTSLELDFDLVTPEPPPPSSSSSSSLLVPRTTTSSSEQERPAVAVVTTSSSPSQLPQQQQPPLLDGLEDYPCDSFRTFDHIIHNNNGNNRSSSSSTSSYGTGTSNAFSHFSHSLPPTKLDQFPNILPPPPALPTSTVARSIPVPKPNNSSNSNNNNNNVSGSGMASGSMLPPSSQPSSQGSSGSAFLNSLLNNNPDGQYHHHSLSPYPQQQQLLLHHSKHAQQQAQSQSHAQSQTPLLSHTPPSAISASSYEQHHFGKRMRSGSVSGRLRSASEFMDEKQWLVSGLAGNNNNNNNISNNNSNNNNAAMLDHRSTKMLLKDLILIGDEQVQVALDQFEMTGDSSMLEEMIASGTLQHRVPADLDLLDDLDLDFLNVHDEEAVVEDMIADSERQHHQQQHVSNNINHNNNGMMMMIHDNSNNINNAQHQQQHQHQQSSIFMGVRHPGDDVVAMGMKGRSVGGAGIGAAGGRSNSPISTGDVPPVTSTSTLLHHRLQQQQQQQQQQEVYQQQRQEQQHVPFNMVSPPEDGSGADDGIGDFEFNEFADADDCDAVYSSMQIPMESSRVDGGASCGGGGGGVSVGGVSVGGGNGSKQASLGASPQDMQVTEYERRMRSNSLFSALLNDKFREQEAAAGGIGAHTTIAGTHQHHQYAQQQPQPPPPQRQQQNQQQTIPSWMDRYTSTPSPPSISNDEEMLTSSQSPRGGIRINKKLAARRSASTGGIAASLLAAASTASSNNDLAAAERPGPASESTRKKAQQQPGQPRRPGRTPKDKKQPKDSNLTAIVSSSSSTGCSDANMANAEQQQRQHVPGSGLPRSLSDPNLRTSHDDLGLRHVERPDGWVGAYSPESRKVRIDRFLAKRNHRVWSKTIKYDVRKNFADSRLRVKGRFVRKEDELLMRELMSLT